MVALSPNLDCKVSVLTKKPLRSNRKKTGVFMGARISTLPTNTCSTENKIPLQSLAKHIVLSKFWKVDLDCRVTR